MNKTLVLSSLASSLLALSALAADEAAILKRLREAEPLTNVSWQAENPYELLKDVTLLGRTPTRHSRDIAKGVVGIGYETLDRSSFDPSWTYRHVGEAGIKWARCQTGWIRSEREKGVYDFKWLDDVVDGLRAEGVETWLSLSFGNPLYTKNVRYEREIAAAKAAGKVVPGWARGYVGEGPVYHGAEAMAAWRNYVRAIARHYRGRVRVWEIWNEPEGFWCDHNETFEKHLSPSKKYGVPTATRQFASFMRETAEIVREEIPDAQISFDLARVSSAWVPGLAEAGVGSIADIYCIHGYEPYPEASLREMCDQARALFRRPDGTPLRIWQGESGRSAGPCSNGVVLPTEYSQARFVARRITSDLREGIDVSSIFTVTDFLAYYPDGRDSLYGMLDGKTHKRRHSFYTLQCLSWLFDGIARAPENFIYFHTTNDREFTDQQPYASVRTASFRRRGIPVFAFWQQQHVELNAAPIIGHLTLVTRSDRSAFDHPVLIDPVRCQVWDISKLFKPCEWGFGTDEVGRLFAVDYPLFVTDLAALGQ